MKGELVVAHYKENVAWAKKASDYKQWIYNKSGRFISGEITVQNFGREAATYLMHMRFNYGKPLAWTFFVQGSPEPHISTGDMLTILAEWPNERRAGFNPSKGLHFFGHHPVIPVEQKAGGDDAANDVPGLWAALFESPMPENMMFLPGANFALSYDALKSRSVGFYHRAEYLASTRPRGPWEFERLWAYLWRPQDKPRL